MRVYLLENQLTGNLTERVLINQLQVCLNTCTFFMTKITKYCQLYVCRNLWNWRKRFDFKKNINLCEVKSKRR